MDLRHYYQKIREIESKIAENFAVVVSHDTPDGGKAGTRTEVPRRLAAKMIAEGSARLAREDERQAFHAEQTEAVRVAEQLAASAKLQVAVLSTTELERLRKQAKA
jgi:hypothetical protein